MIVVSPVRIALFILVLCLTTMEFAAATTDTPADAPAKPAPINPGLGQISGRIPCHTPEATWKSFWTLGDLGLFGQAAHLLDLSNVAVDQQPAVGADVAEKLYQVMKAVRLGPKSLLPAEAGLIGGQEGTRVAFRFKRDILIGEGSLHRLEDPATREPVWLFSRQTVSSVAFWHRLVVQGESIKTAEGLNLGLGPTPDGVRRQTPRASLEGFLTAGRSGNFDLAAHYLDLSSVPPERQQAEGRRLARRLLVILLRQVWVEPSGVSNDEFGTPQRGVPENMEQLAMVKVKGRQVPLMLQRHFNQAHNPVWLMSRDTVQRIDFMYTGLGNGWLGDNLPAEFFSRQFAGLQLWQWVSMLLILILGWAVGRLLGWILIGVMRSLAARTRVSWDDELVRTLDGPLGVILWALLVAAGSPWVGLSPTAREVTAVGWRLLALVGLGWLLFRSVDATARTVQRAMRERNPVGVSFLPIISRFAKALVGVFILLGALAAVGVEVVGVLAGLGLGGVAVAFAAQKTIENLFGAVSIAGDRPFAVGDFVTIDEFSGTVEDVGLRSVRLRTMQRTLVTIPNATVMAAKVVNNQARDRFLFNPVIGLTYGTTADQMALVLDDIRRMLAADRRVHPEGQRVRFRAFGPSALEVEILAWIETTDVYEYWAVVEELNFSLLSIVEGAGASFAYPTQQMYVARAPQPDPARLAAARAEMERRRAERRPEPDDEISAGE